MPGLLERGDKLPPFATPERINHIRENSFLDAQILADDLGIHLRSVELIQRRLGLRRCRNTKYEEEQMRFEASPKDVFMCDGPNCDNECLDPPLMPEGRYDIHFCCTGCYLKWTGKPTLVTVNGHAVLP